MWQEIYDNSATVVAVILCAVAIKLADDFLDEEIDENIGNENWSIILGRGAPIYAMLFLSLSIYLNPPVSLSLFLASYSIGMLHDLKQRLPTNLTGYQESLIAFIIGIILCGWKLMIFAILFVIGVQLIDDCIDVQNDKLAGYRNLAYRLGCVEAYLLAVLSMLVSWWVAEDYFLPVFLATVIFYFGHFWCQGGAKSG